MISRPNRQNTSQISGGAWGWVRFTAKILITFAAFWLFCYACGWLVKPDLETTPIGYPADEIAEAVSSRETRIDLGKSPVIYREVDYAEGTFAPWYPHGESPILDELVKDGRLPAVAERVGPEPLVLEGVDGIGSYGGSWLQSGYATREVNNITGRMSACTLLRWSPFGYPIVPHVAKAFDIGQDHRRFTIHLRQGMRWSDGHPFTADDIMYWWENEADDPAFQGSQFLPATSPMRLHRSVGRISKIDDYTLSIEFDQPHGMFPELLASHGAEEFTNSPRHYLEQFHPRLGNQELIEAVRKSRRLPSAHALYTALKKWDNPEHPRLWPWIYRSYRIDPPQVFVRNPFYFAVDTAGNQLPYVDRIVQKVDLIGVAASNGEYTLDWDFQYFGQYTLLMSQRKRNRYQVLHWTNGGGSFFLLHPNLNLKESHLDASAARKRTLLNDKRFRRALSLAIDREALIEAEYSGVTKPAQAAPGPESPFYEPTLYHAFIEYDPDRSNRLLDEIGLTARDREGYRTFPDGSRMTFYLNMATTQSPGKAQLVVDDWNAVGVRTILKVRAGQLYSFGRTSRLFDFSTYGVHGQILPIIEPNKYIPTDETSTFALGYSKWYRQGGLYGEADTSAPGVIEPALDHPLRRGLELYEEIMGQPDRGKQIELFREILKIAAENLWTINVSTPTPVIAVVTDGFRNVPRELVFTGNFKSPGNAGLETFFFESPADSPAVVKQIKNQLASVPVQATIESAGLPEKGLLSRVVRGLFIGIGLTVVVLVGVRHPYVGRRLLLMLPTLFLVSLLAFFVIQLPPGDYLTYLMAQLEETGDAISAERIEEIRRMFLLDQPMPIRYLQWSGLRWFFTFSETDLGLLQGYMGRSMQTLGSVNELIGNRILLTFMISLGTILFTWILALPIGIYSAVRQYSIGDYVATLIGFIGMSVPSFLLALLLMYFSSEVFGVNVSGLFSPEFAAQPGWSYAKVIDLLKHIWVPVVIIGVAGTASLIRVMRGNLLDELQKPYVTTARAKGVSPGRLLIKYPVRLALNPVISTIGGIFPQLVSGGAIVAIVLSLPTVGPLMLNAIMREDMYLAGSMLMVLSLLGVLGVLVSDLLLLVLDPRIRMGAGSR
jgi:ABC-type dipeptide/oligopeptide/nickel transport system permease component/ABC-type transport system substrate-binding protein